ncbi:MAG: 3-deoxy-manno-octulosonate cytidylyltransferase [Puniceicoccales bacterium]|nr:3-deoxy-manno-octulosonate cytidylyltransferase [Puniceicoccales bacterium]
MTVTVAIPARLASSRLPRKVLLPLAGKPVVQHVWERAKKMRSADRIVILADGAEVAAAARAFGAEAILTDPNCPSGTARLASVLGQLEGDFFLNVQGDEPCIEPTLLDALVERWRRTQCALVTAVARLGDPTRLANPNVVKVVRGDDGRALYFSRSPVPHRRGLPVAEWLADGAVPFWSHIGVYGYSRDALAAYPALPATRLETVEMLEQLRFLAAGMVFQTVETDYHPVSIDTPEDFARASELFAPA